MPGEKAEFYVPFLIVKRIRYARQKLGYSQRQFAMAMGVDQSKWSKIERGKQSMDVGLLTKVNSVLQLDYGYYFGERTFEHTPGATDRVLKRSLQDYLKLTRSSRTSSGGSEELNLGDLAQRLKDSYPIQELVRSVFYWDDWMVESFAQTTPEIFLQGARAAASKSPDRTEETDAEESSN